jgi:membrane fusion protein (multidrug efflux system)
MINTGKIFMKRIHWGIALLCLVIIVLGALFYFLKGKTDVIDVAKNSMQKQSLSERHKKNDKPPHLSEKKRMAKELFADDLIQAKVAPVIDELPFTGTVTAERQAGVSSETSGIVKQVYVKEGSTVKKGQLLAIIDPINNQLDTISSQAEVDNAKATLALLAKKREQQKVLLKEGFISKISFDEIDNEYIRQISTVKMKEASMAKNRQNLMKNHIIAPISGSIYKKLVQEGELVNPGTQLFGISDISSLELTANIPSLTLSNIMLGTQAVIKSGASEIPAVVSRINPVINASTQTVDIYLKLANSQGVLRSGQFVQGKLPLHVETQGIRLPYSAVRGLSKGKDTWVMIIEQRKNKSILSKKPVNILLKAENSQEVSVTGIEEGQWVISNELPGSKPGDEVIIPRQNTNKGF